MIINFKIYEYNSNNETLIDLGYGIYLYRSIFFKKDKMFTQYNIETFFRNRGENLTRRLFSGYLSDGDIMTKEISDILISDMVKKRLIEQISIIQNIISSNKFDDSLFRFVGRDEILQAFDILKNYYEVDGFNNDLSYRNLGKTIEESTEAIDKFYMEKEIDKYNL